MARKPKTPARPRDVSQLAKRIVELSTGEASDETPEPTMEEERASKGGQARADNLTPEERSAIAKRAAQARWSKRNK